MHISRLTCCSILSLLLQKVVDIMLKEKKMCIFLGWFDICKNQALLISLFFLIIIFCFTPFFLFLFFFLFFFFFFLLPSRYGSRTVGLSGGRGKRLGLRHTPQVCLSLVPCQQLTPSVHTLMLVLSLLTTQL